MIRTGISAAVLFLLFVTVKGQTSDREIAGLRNLLKIPASTTLLTEPIAPKLPSGRIIKVYVAAERDDKVNQRVNKWIDKWNKEEGAKYEQMQIVSATSEADVILAFRKVRERVPQARTVLAVGSVYPENGGSRTERPNISTKTYFSTAHYTYLITRASDDFPVDALQILYGDVDKSNIRDYSDPEKYLFAELKKLIKKN